MKKELRQRALAARNALEKREEKSRQIAAHILESAAYQNTERIFTFVSMGSESGNGGNYPTGVAGWESCCRAENGEAQRNALL